MVHSCQFLSLYLWGNRPTVMMTHPWVAEWCSGLMELIWKGTRRQLLNQLHGLKLCRWSFLSQKILSSYSTGCLSKSSISIEKLKDSQRSKTCLPVSTNLHSSSFREPSISLKRNCPLYWHKSRKKSLNSTTWSRNWTAPSSKRTTTSVTWIRNCKNYISPSTQSTWITLNQMITTQRRSPKWRSKRMNWNLK